MATRHCACSVVCVIFVIFASLTLPSCVAGFLGGSSDNNPSRPTGVVDLLDKTLETRIAEVPDDEWVLVEFYASWCPHCRHFKPEYEAVGDFFMGGVLGDQPRPEPKVWVGRIDCATEKRMCAAFRISSYPSMMFGRPKDFKPNQTFKADNAPESTLEKVSTSHTANAVISWLSKRLHADYDASTSIAVSMQADKDAKMDALAGGRKKSTVTQAKEVAAKAADPSVSGATQVKRKHKPPADTAASAPGTEGKNTLQFEDPSSNAKLATHATEAMLAVKQVDLQDVLAATVQAYDDIVHSPALTGARGAFVDILTLLEAAHPVTVCRDGAAALLADVDSLWPLEVKEPPTGALLARPVCGNVKQPEWRACAGSSPEFRGYTCGLWQLFHTTAAAVPDTDGGLVWMDGVDAFIRNFFACEKCRQHFITYLDARDAKAVASRRDASLWMWRKHNGVNERLAYYESLDGQFDPSWPKMQ